MILNDFNSKLNLPAYCSEQGIKGYQFVKLPKFGWYAYNATHTDIRNIFEFLDQNIIADECTYLLKEKKNLHEFKLVYSEIGTRNLVRDYLRWGHMNALMRDSLEEFKQPKFHKQGSYINLYEELLKLGTHAHFMQIFPGLLTKSLMESKEYRDLSWPRPYLNKVIIPTYCTPRHMCSLELFNITEPNKRQTAYVNGEKGWIAPSLRGTACADIKTLQWKEGFVWDYKADYWTNSPIDVDMKMSVPDCITVWKEAKNTKFKLSPLDIIERNQAIKEIPQHIRSLSHGQVAQLEKRYGEDFLGLWKNLNYQEITIGTLRFVQRDNQYFIESRNSSEEFANFTVHVDKIVKKYGVFVRIGHINYENHIIPFEIDNNHFLSSKGLVKKISELFFEQGVGLPIVFNSYQSYLVDVVNRFNRHVQFEAVNS